MKSRPRKGPFLHLFLSLFAEKDRLGTEKGRAGTNPAPASDAFFNQILIIQSSVDQPAEK